MTQKLTIINNALANTANNLAEDTDPTSTDPTEEWQKASIAYDRWLPILIEKYDWDFATITRNLVRITDEAQNPSQRFDYAYRMPSDCLHLQSVWQSGNPLNYEILNDIICTDFLATDAEPLMAKYVRIPDRTAMSNLFFAALTLKVEVGCLRSLNEDYTEATRRDEEADLMLMEARSRNAQQQPRRPLRQSRMLNRRRRRI